MRCSWWQPVRSSRSSWATCWLASASGKGAADGVGMALRSHHRSGAGALPGLRAHPARAVLRGWSVTCEWQQHRSSPGQAAALVSSMGQVLACCFLLAQTTPDLVARVSLTLPLGGAPGEALEILRQSERLAQEYGLRCWGQVENRAITLRFARRTNTANRRRGDE